MSITSAVIPDGLSLYCSVNEEHISGCLEASTYDHQFPIAPALRLKIIQRLEQSNLEVLPKAFLSALLASPIRFTNPVQQLDRQGRTIKG